MARLNPEGPLACSADELRAVRTTIWDLITQSVPAAEQDEVRRIIGSKLIDNNQLVFAEATALAEIIGDIQLQTENLVHRRNTVLLATPQRELVEEGVRLLLSKIQNIATSYERGKHPQTTIESLVAQSASEKRMLQYISTIKTPTNTSGGRAPLTPPPRTPPSRPISSCGSRPSTAGSGASIDSSQVVSSLRTKLNIFDIGAVSEQLRDAFRVEHDALLEDVQYLHECLQAETEVHAISAGPQPSVNELCEFSEKLERTWIEVRLTAPGNHGGITCHAGPPST
mmetsp:Transcript_8308/g.21453  ORF Transcript_8308/g.21453 Transcript_8308/m.21453 type:complete len:284 (+) Transcript_8308:368-1219(+)